MIVLDLSCANRHRFEGWFASSEDFDSQSGKRLLSCPICGCGDVKKLPSSPHVRRAGDQPAAREEEGPRKSAGKYALVRAAAELLRHVLENSEDVGERFPDEARRIHRGEAAARDIRGVATKDEAIELLDEGVLVIPLPLPPKSDMH